MAAKIQLTYFGFVPTFKVLPARLALEMGGVEYDYKGVSGAEWKEMKPTLDLPYLPLLVTEKGEHLQESVAVLLYCGIKANLMYNEPVQDALAMQIVLAFEEITGMFGPTMKLQGEERKAAQLEVVKTKLPDRLEAIDKLVAKSAGKHAVGDKLTIADCQIAARFKFAKSNFWAEYPHDIMDKYTHLKKVNDAFLAEPRIIACIEKLTTPA